MAGFGLSMHPIVLGLEKKLCAKDEDGEEEKRGADPTHTAGDACLCRIVVAYSIAVLFGSWMVPAPPLPPPVVVVC